MHFGTIYARIKLVNQIEQTSRNWKNIICFQLPV